MATDKIAFFAYPGQPKEIGQTITSAVEDYNTYSPIKIQTWEKNDINGIPLTDPIFEKIKDAEYLAADVTALNDNVIFEIGYAIGKGKRTLLFQNKSLQNENELASKIGIFDTLGYEGYENSKELSSLLKRHTDYGALQIRKNINHQAPVYIVEPERKGDAIMTLVSRTKKARWRFRTFSPKDDIRLAVMDAIRHVSQSAGVICPLVNQNHVEYREHNSRALFVAGLAFGAEIPLLILYPPEYKPPLDIRDISTPYSHPEDIREIIQTFSLDITEYTQKTVRQKIPERKLLSKISVGDPTAENEMADLGDYYLETDEFIRALRGEVNLVVGRKGTGKTALFIQLRDAKRAIPSNVVIDLKPEGYQLVKLKEHVLTFMTEGAQQHLITAFWEYLLVLEIIHKILESDKIIHMRDHRLTQPYNNLKELYGINDLSYEGDFSERLIKLCNSLANECKNLNKDKEEGVSITSAAITEVLYRHDFKQLLQALEGYLKMKGEGWLLFDNIDKGWSVGGIDETDTFILRCLIDASRKLERDLRKRGIDFHSITFIRDDVYHLLMDRSSDYGKEMRVSLDWSDGDVLGKLLEKRISTSLEDNEIDTKTSQLWLKMAVSHYDGVSSLDYMIERSLMRPRNLLKIFKHCLSYAIKLDHERIEIDDISRGLRAYSQDLLIDVDRELSDVLPTAKGIIYEFVDEQYEFSYEELITLMACVDIESLDAEKVINFMLYYGVLGIQKAQNEPIYIYDVNYDSELLTARIRKWGTSIKYVINPGLRSALQIEETEHEPLFKQAR